MKLARLQPQNFKDQTKYKGLLFLNQPSEVRIEIVNILGQRITILVNGYKESGNYQVRWDGTDDKGNIVANGIYFYRLITQKRTIVKKMLLLK